MVKNLYEKDGDSDHSDLQDEYYKNDGEEIPESL